MNIEPKKLEQTLIATTRLTVKTRAEIRGTLEELAQEIPRESVAGAPFCIFQFITSVRDGYDVEIGFPVTHEIETDTLKTRLLPAMGVLSIVHRGSQKKLGEAYSQLYGYAEEHGIISDEFCREVYDMVQGEPDETQIEVQFVIHQWNDRLAKNLDRVLGEETRRVVMQGSDASSVESGVDERFRWVKGMVERLNGLADEHQKYDVLSRCAHVFPASQIAKLTAVYQETKARTQDPWQAVDAVLDFMASDPGWGEERPAREGHVIYSAKSPRDPQGYEKAESDLERRKAYCFCPLIRQHMDQGMPIDFCYCGAGWYRQQWEGAIGRPVSITLVKSVLKGDDECQFAIQLPQDL